MGVVVRRYIDILIIIITFPYSTCISSFWQQHPYFFVHFKNVFLVLLICDPLRKNQPYAKYFFFFNGFHNIFTGSIVVANLKQISCSLTEVRLLFMPFFE